MGEGQKHKKKGIETVNVNKAKAINRLLMFSHRVQFNDFQHFTYRASHNKATENRPNTTMRLRDANKLELTNSQHVTVILTNDNEELR